MKSPLANSLRFIPVALGLAVGLLANNAMAQNYFGVTAGIQNNGVYSWDAPTWSTSSSGPFTSNWLPGAFARFYGGASDNYTVTVNASEANTGMYLNAVGATLNINNAGSGSLSENSGVDAFLIGGSYTESINVNATITGSGTVAPEGSGSLYLNVANSYTGGTALGDSGNTLTYFNNAGAFSSGGITLNRTGIANFSTLLNNSGTTVTLANNFQLNSAVGTGTGLNFASSVNSPVVSSGTWSLGTYNLNLRNAGGSTAPLTISGAISGSGNLVLSGNQGADSTGSKIILSGANTYTGTTTVTGSGGTYGGNGAITLVLGAANTIASSSSLIMAGGPVDPDGFHHVMSSTTLSLTANSTFDYTSGTAEMDFANSSGVAWTVGKTLNLVSTGGGNWNLSSDYLEVGTDGTGLTTAQLAEIEFNGADLGAAGITSTGYIYDTAQMVPEPSTALLGLLGGLGVMSNIRRRRTA